MHRSPIRLYLFGTRPRAYLQAYHLLLELRRLLGGGHVLDSSRLPPKSPPSSHPLTLPRSQLCPTICNFNPNCAQCARHASAFRQLGIRTCSISAHSLAVSCHKPFATQQLAMAQKEGNLLESDLRRASLLRRWRDWFMLRLSAIMCSAPCPSPASDKINVATKSELLILEYGDLCGLQHLSQWLREIMWNPRVRLMSEFTRSLTSSRRIACI